MFYMFIKMGSGWHGKKIYAIKSTYAQEFVANGDIIVFADDIEGFIELMGIEESDITW